MSILRILSSGEERVMIRRTSMAMWKREHPLGPGIDQEDRKISSRRSLD
jgi:hypothetical protein